MEAPFPQMSDMLKSSSLDAALAVDPFYTRILNAKSGYVVSHFTAELPTGTAVTLWISTRKWVTANPAVAKGFKEGLVEARRGRGMFVNAGARTVLLRGDRRKFLDEEWPRIRRTMRRLGLSAEELLRAPSGEPAADAAPDRSDAPRSPEKER